ncbi:MAG: hypothetical protein P1S59_01720 [bacterium]|nr:hypothetical protein [bacterium]
MYPGIEVTPETRNLKLETEFLEGLNNHHSGPVLLLDLTRIISSHH